MIFNKPYYLDFVFVLDATGDMAEWKPLVHEFVRRFIKSIQQLFEEKSGQPVTPVRARIVDFADYATEHEDAIRETEFFNLPEEYEHFNMMLDGIDYGNRGGDVPENGLEALWYAIYSDWHEIRSGDRGRQIIVVISNAPPLDLRERECYHGYPSDEFPRNVEELELYWATAPASGTNLGMHKRLVLIVPAGEDAAGHSWEKVITWENTVHVPFERLAAIKDYEEIESIIRSIL